MWDRFEKFLSGFIEKTEEGSDYKIGFSYLFRNIWYYDLDVKERTVFLCLPLPLNSFRKYNNPYGDEIRQGERWLSIVFCFRYIKFAEKIRFEPYIRFFWMPIGEQILVTNRYLEYENLVS